MKQNALNLNIFLTVQYQHICTVDLKVNSDLHLNTYFNARLYNKSTAFRMLCGRSNHLPLVERYWNCVDRDFTQHCKVLGHKVSVEYIKRE